VRKLSRAVEQSPAAIVITNPNGEIEYVNPKFTQTTCYTLAEAVGKNPRILKSGHTTQQEYQQLWDTISSGGEWRGVFQNRKKNGDLYWESATIAPIWDQNGAITHFLAVKEDITERKRLEKQLQLQATTDELTGIYNRRHFMEAATQELKRAIRFKHPLAVAMIDLDHFKQINDTYGHAAGDQALIMFSQIIQKGMVHWVVN
jgi:PAS domain S-box-containing protein